MDFGLKNKVAVVAASSEGLGRASALALAQEGAKLVICSRRKKEIVEAARDIEKQTRATVVPVVADVSKADDIKKLFDEARGRFGTVHILVNNAGGPPVGDILSMPDSEWQKGFELTLMSTVRMTREVLPMMVQQKWGRIITITSFVAKQPANELILSVTIRSGIHGLTKILSNLYAKDNITANTVCPGNIMTRRQEELSRVRAAQNNTTPERYLAEAVRSIPAGRYGRPEEIGNVVAFLASEQAGYINGVNLLVDGGMTKGIH